MMVICFPLKFRYYKFLWLFPFSGIRKLKKSAANCKWIDVQVDWFKLKCALFTHRKELAVFQTMTRGWQFSLSLIQSWRWKNILKKIWKTLQLYQETKPPMRFQFSSTLSCKRECRYQNDYRITSCGISGTGVGAEKCSVMYVKQIITESKLWTF